MLVVVTNNAVIVKMTASKYPNTKYSWPNKMLMIISITVAIAKANLDCAVRLGMAGLCSSGATLQL